MTNIVPTFSGQDNLAGALDALQMKVFSGEILTAFNAMCVFQDKHQTREIANGKSAQFPAIGKTTGAYHVAGTPLGGVPIAHAERVITIDDLLVAHTWIADIDEAKNHYDVRSEYSKQLAEALAKTFDVNVAITGLLTARAAATITGEAGGTVINGGAAVRTTPALIKTALFAAAQKLDENNVSENDRYAFMKPVSYWAAAGSTDLINKDWGGRGEIAKGTFESLAGITVVKTNHLPNSVVATGPAKYQGTFTNSAMLVMHRGAVGTVRLLSLSMQSEYMALYQATLMAARYAVGHGSLRPEAAIEIAAVA